jgi:endonuclease/exonuclease/phosphatase family metal-dependent hydrolase
MGESICNHGTFRRVQFPGGRQVDIYGTHMQAGYSNNDLERSRLVNSAFILRHSGDERPVVLAGDLNMEPPGIPTCNATRSLGESRGCKDARSNV